MDPRPFLLLCLALLALTTVAALKEKHEERVIYGEDNRKQPYQLLGNEQVTKLQASEVAILHSTQLNQNDDGTWAISDYDYFDSAETDGSSCDLCVDEPFYGEPLISFCSGFLVDTNKVATAGHCVDATSCDDIVMIFDLKILNGDREDINLNSIPDSNVYFCSDYTHKFDEADDWAVILMDSHVASRKPIPVDFVTPALDTKLTMIGHPWGLPTKVDTGGRVKDYDERDVKFQASTDSYAGNSGSMVVDTATGKAIGILVSGNEDFAVGGGETCCRSNVCSELDGCSGTFESITKLSSVPDWFGWYPALKITGTVNIDESHGHATFNVSLDAVSTDDVSFNFRTIAGSAGTDDYQQTKKKLTINAGDSYIIITVDIFDDSNDEFDEYFEVAISSPIHATLGPEGSETRKVTILDNDDPPSVGMAGDEVSESDGTASVCLYLSEASEKVVQVKYTTVPKSAGNSDYVSSYGIITFDAWETDKTINISIVNDTLDEETEVFQIKLSKPENCIIDAETANVIINDDDPEPFVSISGSTIRTELSGIATLTLTLKTPSGKEVKVYLDKDGDATSGDDYQLDNWEPVIAPGQSSVNVVMTIYEDSDITEGNETAVIFIDGADNASLGDTEADVIIMDSLPRASCGTDCSFSSTGCSLSSTVDIALEDNIYTGVSWTATACGSTDYQAEDPQDSATVVTISAYDTDGNKLPFFRFSRSNPLVVKFPIRAEQPLWSLLMVQDGETIWSDATSTCGLQPIIDDLYITFFVCHLTTFSLLSTQPDRDPLLEWSFNFFCGDQANPIISGSFVEMHGLQNSNEWECEQYTASNGREVTNCLPSQIVSAPIVAMRGLSYDDQFWNWRDNVANGQLADARQNCTVLIYDRSYLAARQFTLFNAWPSAVEIKALQPYPEIDPQGKPGEVAAMEVITIIHEGFSNGADPEFFQIFGVN